VVALTELDDASFVTSLALVSDDQSYGVAQIVPDGVTQVRLCDTAAGGATVATASATVQDNLALLSPVLSPTIPRREPFGVRAHTTGIRPTGRSSRRPSPRQRCGQFPPGFSASRTVRARPV
jgi:hypothetical protein